MKPTVAVLHWYSACILFKVEVLKVLKSVFYIKTKTNEKLDLLNYPCHAFMWLLCIYMIIMLKMDKCT